MLSVMKADGEVKYEFGRQCNDIRSLAVHRNYIGWRFF
jgi:hypothetical protein